MIARLAEASGHNGMIGGQMIDMLADSKLRRGRRDRSAAAARPASCSNSPARRGRSWARRRREDRARLQGLCRGHGRGVPDHRRPAGRDLDGRKDRQGGRQGCRYGQGDPGDLAGRWRAPAPRPKSAPAARSRRWAPMPPMRRNCRPCRFFCWTGTAEVPPGKKGRILPPCGSLFLFHALHGGVRRFCMKPILKSCSHCADAGSALLL